MLKLKVHGQGQKCSLVLNVPVASRQLMKQSKVCFVENWSTCLWRSTKVWHPPTLKFTAVASGQRHLLIHVWCTQAQRAIEGFFLCKYKKDEKREIH